MFAHIVRETLAVQQGAASKGEKRPWSASLDNDLPWWTAEGGGVSSGGDFSLHGVIGQPDAGAMSGEDFSLIGGFLGIERSPQNKVYLPLVQR
jgi:hypothetical protein